MHAHRLLTFLLPLCGISSLFLVTRRLGEYVGFHVQTDFDHVIVYDAKGIYNSSLPLTPKIQAHASNNRSSGSHVALNAGEGRLCSRDEIETGSWVPVRLNKPPYVSKTLHLRCYPHAEYTQGHWDTYDWKPESNCKFAQWKRQGFCSILKRATVLVIGDSLSWEHYSSMSQLLGLRIHQNSQHESKLNQHNLVQMACKDQVRLVFRRDDLLTNLTDAIDKNFPQVIVINRGSHYVNDTRLISGMEKNIQELNDWRDRCKSMNMTCHLLWRTSVPGHPLCDRVNFTKPSNNLLEMEAWISNRSNYDNHTIGYHWYDYKHQNELILNMLEHSLKFNYDVIDAYNINILRPDEHRAHQSDCLHNCYPGKMDVYSRLLLHFLNRRRTPGDVDDLEARFNRSVQRRYEKKQQFAKSKVLADVSNILVA
jgi:hypothetical protein